MNFKDAKAWAKKDLENREWQDKWKYGKIIRGMGLGDGLIFDWGEDATDEQKELLEDSITNISKWASKIEEILDNPPTKAERKIIKTLKRIKAVK